MQMGKRLKFKITIYLYTLTLMYLFTLYLSTKKFASIILMNIQMKHEFEKIFYGHLSVCFLLTLMLLVGNLANTK